MKEITKSSRLLALLERMFRDLNRDFFNDELDTPSKTKNRSLRYICPKCNTIIRANKTVSVICGNCLVPFEQR